MLRYALRRAVWLIPTLLIVTFLVYVALRLGTDPVASYRRTNIRVSKKKLDQYIATDRKSTRLNSSHIPLSRMPSSA